MFAFKDFWLTQQSPFFARSHLWHPPEEPLVQMPRGHREDVDRIFLVLLRLFSLASTRETSERQNEKWLFDSFEHLKIKNEITVLSCTWSENSRNQCRSPPSHHSAAPRWTCLASFEPDQHTIITQSVTTYCGRRKEENQLFCLKYESNIIWRGFDSGLKLTQNISGWVFTQT